MPTITVLPHEHYCKEGVVLQAKSGELLIEVLFRNGIHIEHACEMQCACTTCHVYVRQGYDDLADPSDQEDDMLDRAFGLDMTSRLSCQIIVGDQDLIIEIPKYTINQVAERH